jgi:hypothetical protein
MLLAGTFAGCGGTTPKHHAGPTVARAEVPAAFDAVIPAAVRAVSGSAACIRDQRPATVFGGPNARSAVFCGPGDSEYVQYSSAADALAWAKVGYGGTRCAPAAIAALGSVSGGVANCRIVDNGGAPGGDVLHLSWAYEQAPIDLLFAQNAPTRAAQVKAVDAAEQYIVAAPSK